jgi:hypothetical protein
VANALDSRPYHSSSASGAKSCESATTSRAFIKDPYARRGLRLGTVRAAALAGCYFCTLLYQWLPDYKFHKKQNEYLDEDQWVHLQVYNSRRKELAIDPDRSALDLDRMLIWFEHRSYFAPRVPDARKTHHTPTTTLHLCADPSTVVLDCKAITCENALNISRTLQVDLA